MDISGGPHKLGPLQIQPLTHSAPIVKIWENYTNDTIHVRVSLITPGHPRIPQNTPGHINTLKDTFI